MGDAISSFFQASIDLPVNLFNTVFGGGADAVQPVVKGPSTQETTAQKEQKDLLQAKEILQAKEREGRQKVITARAAGPQTLFKRADEIPKATKLGGGRRS